MFLLLFIPSQIPSQISPQAPGIQQSCLSVQIPHQGAIRILVLRSAHALWSVVEYVHAPWHSIQGPHNSIQSTKNSLVSLSLTPLPESSASQQLREEL